MFNCNIFNNPTYLVIVIFLISTLILGLVAGKNIKTFKEYVFGKGRFSTATLTLSYLATFLGAGSIIHNCNRSFKMGIFPFIMVVLPFSTLFFGVGMMLYNFFKIYFMLGFQSVSFDTDSKSVKTIPLLIIMLEIINIIPLE